MGAERVCTRCGGKFPETEEFFYLRRPTGRHKSLGFQPSCKSCWKLINAYNKLKRKGLDTA